MANSTPVADPEKKEKVFMYCKVSLSLENSILPKEKFSPTPSEIDGLKKETEIELRILGCELIQTSGVLLRLPQVAMATGQVLFQRFFYSKSFVRHAMEVVAMACVTLASKIEEAPRRIRDVINVFHHIKQVKAGKTIQPLVLDQNYINLKNQVIKAERRVLKELGFCVHVKHPHKIIVTLLEVLDKVNNKKLLQTAWNYMTDSLRSEVFVRYNPESIACACIYLSARVLQIPLPNKPAWYLIFDVEEAEIHSICQSILNLYTMRKPDPDQLEKTVEEVKKIHQEAKLKAKGILNAASLMSNHHSFSPISNPSSPKSNKSPNVEIKKEKEDAKVNNGVSPKEMNHRKRRSLSPMDDSMSPRRKKKSKTSSSGSQSSHSPSPRHKHSKTPPRGYKESHRSRSRSKTRDSSKKSKHRSSHKTHKRSRSRSESASPLSRKHSSKKSYKTKSSKNRHISKSPPRIYDHNHHHHTNSHEKSSHKSRKEKSNRHSKEKTRR